MHKYKNYKVDASMLGTLNKDKKVSLYSSNDIEKAGGSWYGVLYDRAKLRAFSSESIEECDTIT
jgi:hypothetical protein